MSASFNRTIRSLHTDQSKRYFSSILLTATILIAWFVWFGLGQVQVFEVSETARLEATNRARPVVTLVASQIAKNDLVLGQYVKQGAVLVQLDDQTQQLAVQEGRARLAETQGRLEALSKEIDAAKMAAVLFDRSGPVAWNEQQARIDESDSHLKYAEERFARLQKLGEQRAASTQEISEARADVEAKRASKRALQICLKRIQEDHAVEKGDRLSQIAKLKCQSAELVGQSKVQQATLKRLEREVELRKVHAPVSGRVASVADSPVGAAVQAGEKLAMIVPDSQARAVAHFPLAASGRILAGQPARLRLDGFAWTQYGHLSATVTDVASEPTDGLLRVEFQLTPILISKFRSNTDFPVRPKLPWIKFRPLFWPFVALACY